GEGDGSDETRHLHDTSLGRSPGFGRMLRASSVSRPGLYTMSEPPGFPRRSRPMSHRYFSRGLVPVLTALVLIAPAPVRAADGTLGADGRAAIDATVRDALATSGVPSASIAVVRDGRIAYAQAYGSARLEPAAAAATGMRYSIGSVSKQFTATAILMLAEEGK